MDAGEEMMIWCDGGSSLIKRQIYPPALEIIEGDGMYVLHDDGPPADWRYVYVSKNGELQ